MSGLHQLGLFERQQLPRQQHLHVESGQLSL